MAMWARVHSITGMLILTFVALHLAVHLTALVGIAAHVRFLSVVQVVYRNPVVEPVLLALAVVAQVPHLEWVVVAGLGVFGIAFAVNSSVHSYLVLAYAGSEKAAEDVGFYYAANALGRCMGTLLSGLLYQWGGLLYALLGSASMLFVCWVATWRLPTQLPTQTHVERGVA
jgi:hypothetical protein